MTCKNCDCEDKSHETQKTDWTDAVLYVSVAITIVGVFYFVTSCIGQGLQ